MQQVVCATIKMVLGSRFGNSRIVDSGRLTFRRPCCCKACGHYSLPSIISHTPLISVLSRDRECCVFQDLLSPCLATDNNLTDCLASLQQTLVPPSNNPVSTTTNLAPTLPFGLIVLAEASLVAETLTSTPYVPHPSCYFHRRSGS